jgi:hypothetical protein
MLGGYGVVFALALRLPIEARALWLGAGALLLPFPAGYVTAWIVSGTASRLLPVLRPTSDARDPLQVASAALGGVGAAIAALNVHALALGYRVPDDALTHVLLDASLWLGLLGGGLCAWVTDPAWRGRGGAA